MNLIIYDEPSYEKNELENTEVFPACSVTAAMIIKLKEEETVLQDGSTDRNDVELKHILFAHVNEHILYGDDDMSSYAIDTDRNP